ncbi:MAG: hypothetical protein HY904_21675 [Deltaproteobacteria bacterium]|nr:hypothetical protein [Deltaproteobacteria bacterium]
MVTFAWMLVLAAAVTPPEPAGEFSPDMVDALRRAQGHLDELEDQKALDALEPLAARTDLVSAEVAQVQLWRGAALMGLNREGEAREAFAVSRGCDPGLAPPARLSPKIAKALASSKPGFCTAVAFAAWDPAQAGPRPPAYDPPPPPVTASARGRGGPPVLAIVGGGVVAAGGVVLLAGGLGAVLAMSALAGSFPVHDAAVANTEARQARQQAIIALSLRLGAAAGLAVAGLAGLVGLGTLLGGVGAATVGVLR